METHSIISLGDLAPVFLALAILISPPVLFLKLFLARKYEKKESDEATEINKPFGRLKYFLNIFAIGLVASIMLTQSSDSSAISVIAAILATAAMERRFRDIGFSRWWAILGLTPMIPLIAILGAWAHILCLITPALSRKCIQRKKEVRNTPGHIKENIEYEISKASIFQKSLIRIKRKTWIIGSLVIIAVLIPLVSYLAHRHTTNRELAPLILATELNPNYHYAWTDLAREAYRSKRISIAENAAKKAIGLGARGQSSGYLWLGRIYRDQKKNEEAIYCYQRSISCAAKTDLGDLYQHLGDYGKSIKEYLKAIDLLLKKTQEEDAGWWDWSNLGDAYLKVGKRKEAHDAFAAALILNSDLEWIKEKMARTSD